MPRESRGLVVLSFSQHTTISTTVACIITTCRSCTLVLGLVQNLKRRRAGESDHPSLTYGQHWSWGGGGTAIGMIFIV